MKNYKENLLSNANNEQNLRRSHSSNLTSSRSSNKSTPTTTPRFSPPPTTLTTPNSQNRIPEPKSPYNSLTHGVRRMIPQEIACKVGCKGAKCKYDNSDWPKDKMIIDGLFSNWITDNIIAMSRPRKELIDDHNLIRRMKELNIKSIFNLQTRNEHKDCGKGVLKESGFSYDPLDFTNAGIFYYNFELEDYSVASMSKMVDMVKVLCFALSEGNAAAIHCHAGLGRTGLFIVCYLIYSMRMTANEAIHFVREKRPGSVQMNEQIFAAKEFEIYLRPFRIVYSFESMPILKRTGSDSDPNDQNDPTSLSSSSSPSLASTTSAGRLSSSTSNSFDLRTFLHRQKYFFHGNDSKKFKYMPKVIYICGEQLKRIAKDLNRNEETITSTRYRNRANANTTDDHLNEIKKISTQYVKNILDFAKSRFDDDRSMPDDNLDDSTRNAMFTHTNSNILIAKALSSDRFSRAVIKKVIRYQKIINETNDGIDTLLNENDPFVLSALIWSWFDQLKVPVLRDQEIHILLKDLPKESFNSKYLLDQVYKLNWTQLERGTLYTINYLISLISSLGPMPSSLEDKLIIQMISSLTQSKMNDDKNTMPSAAASAAAAAQAASGYDQHENNKGICLLNTNKRMRKQHAIFLFKIIRELVADPINISDRTLGKFKFNKQPVQPHYDYVEEVNDDDEYDEDVEVHNDYDYNDCDDMDDMDMERHESIRQHNQRRRLRR